MSCLYRVCSVMLPVYGVEAVTADGAQVLASFPDVFVQRAAAEALARRCNAGGLDPVQLPDVLEDALCSL